MADPAWRIGRLLAAFVLALVLLLLISGWMGRPIPNRVTGPADAQVASKVPVGNGPSTARIPAQALAALRDPSSSPPVIQDLQFDLTVAQRMGSVEPDPRVALLVEQILTETVARLERSLTGAEPVIVGGRPYTLYTRNSYSGEPISQATRYAYDFFLGLGLNTTFHEYTYNGNRWRNVVAERRGLVRPDEVYLISAHLDDMPPGPLAPGADDNASGSTAVLVTAERLSRVDFDCTLRFVLFTGEEQGLRGSAAYADALVADGDDVRGVLNLDMIGYNSDPHPIIDLHVRGTLPGSAAIAETFSQVVDAYRLRLIPEILVDDPLSDLSDNKSFWNRGYSAILAIEDQDDSTPHYHTISDTLDTLDLDYLTEFVRAAAAALAHLGCPSTGLLTGTVTSLDAGLPLSATVTAVAGAFAYTATTDAHGHYSLSLPIYTFTLQAHSGLLGYLPARVTNVHIPIGPAAVQHFVLEPWPYRFFLPLAVARTVY